MLDELEQWAMQQRTLPKSSVRKAIEYMLKLWPGLTRFLGDPRIDIHNNASERALRGLVLGRKNHYGSRSKRGTEAAAIFYTLMESVKQCGVDPDEYIRVAARRAIEKPGTGGILQQLIG